MMTLVVIPSLMHKYTFSAPLAWLFGNHADCVRGIYSYSLDKNTVKQYERFIVELNWFIELYEFRLITAFIKKHKPHAMILFGGLYSQLKYREVFAHSPVDCFIKGDAEIPIRQYVEGADPITIPNMVGRTFENPQSYVFQQKDYAALEFNLDWFPEYTRRWEEFPEIGADVDTDFSRMPLYPKYPEKSGKKLPPELRWRVPPKGGRYHLPMLITARGSCPAVHAGCEYCMGAKDLSQSIFKRPPLILDNDTCVTLLKKIEKRFKHVTLYINSACSYDFSRQHFDLDATIEIDSRSTAADAARLLPAFRSARLHTAVYAEGVIGTEMRTDLRQYEGLEDANHKIYFFAFPQDAANRDIPLNRRLYAELVLPPWTHWDFYNNYRNALSRSRDWYFVTGQDNFYPLPRRMIMRAVRFVVLRILYVLHRLGIVDLKKKFVV